MQQQKIRYQFTRESSVRKPEALKELAENRGGQSPDLVMIH